MSIKDIHKKNLALCINAGEYQGVSLFAFKIYEYVPEPISEAEGFLRVIDEEDEPYYYDAKAFVKVKSAPNGLLIPIVKAKRARKERPARKGNRQTKRVVAS